MPIMTPSPTITPPSLVNNSVHVASMKNSSASKTQTSCWAKPHTRTNYQRTEINEVLYYQIHNWREHYCNWEKREEELLKPKYNLKKTTICKNLYMEREIFKKNKYISFWNRKKSHRFYIQVGINAAFTVSGEVALFSCKRTWISNSVRGTWFSVHTGLYGGTRERLSYASEFYWSTW